jgi:hypothetical protein
MAKRQKECAMRHLIKRPIGAGLDNDPHDVRLVRGVLKGLKGDEIIPEKLSGFIDDDLDTDIRTFQQTAGLTEDGRLNPNGETERNLISRITGEGIDIAAPEDAVLRQSVGDGGENNPEDVVTVKRVLGTTGHLKYDRTASPPPFIDAKTVAALTDFQNETNLLPDGRTDPDGETLAALRKLLEENPDGRSSAEAQVALGPALIPLFLFLARAAPHILNAARQTPAIIAANESAKKLAEQDRKRRSRADGRSEFRGHPPQGTRTENIPLDPDEFGDGREEFPSEPPGKNDGKLEGRPTDPAPVTPETFPLPENPENLVQIFPGGSAKPEIPFIIERKGDEPVRALNAAFARLFEKLGKRYGIVHVGGSRDADGNEIPETHLKNKDTGGLKGGSFPDITFEIPGLKFTIRFYVNTADHLVDGVTLSTRERKAAERILINMEDYAALLTIPKPGADETIDMEAFGKRLESIVKDLKDFADGKIDPKTFERWIKTTEKPPLK